MKSNLIKQFNLPPYIKGKSFGEAANIIQSKFKDRNDNMSNRTKEELLARLAKAQEFVKTQEAMKTQSQEIPDQMDGQIPEGMQDFMPQNGQMALGGAFGLNTLPEDASLSDKFKAVGGSQAGQAIGAAAGQVGNMVLSAGDSTVGAISDTLKVAGAQDPSGIVGGIGTAVNFGNKLFGPSNVDASGNTRVKREKSGLAAASMGLEGAQAGAKIGGPLGAGIGAAAGIATGIISAGKHNREADIANDRYVLGQNSEQRQSDFAYGGPTDPPVKKDVGAYYANGTPALTFKGDGNEDPTKRLGKIPEIGMTIKHPSNHSLRTVLFKDSANNRSLVKDQKGNYLLVPDRNLQLNQTGWESGGEKPMTSAQARYFMDNQKQLAYGGFEDYPPTKKLPVEGTPGADQELLTGAPPIRVTPIQTSYAGMSAINNPVGTQLPSTIQPTVTKDNTKEWSLLRKGLHYAGKGLDASGKFVGENANEMLQYAAPFGNLMELNNLKKTNTVRGARLDNTYTPYNPDMARELNQLNQFNTERALTESSGGDLGALRSNLLASQLNKQKGLSSILANQDNLKASESKNKQQFDLSKDSTNIQLEAAYQDNVAKDTAAYENTKSNLKRALYEDLGKIGKENVDKKTVERMFGYKWNAKYKKYEDNEGKLYDAKDVYAKIKSEKSGSNDAEYQQWRKDNNKD